MTALAAATAPSQDRVLLARGEYAITPILSSAQLQPHLSSLQRLLQICVNDDPASSSLGFRAPLTDDAAAQIWHAVAHELDESSPALHLFVVTPNNRSDEVVATGQVATSPKATHQHRAEIVKLLVHPSARRKGVASGLMRHLESFAKNALRRELLLLDTATETPARALYNSLGWKEWGTCPEYADFADGSRADVTFFIKFLRDT